MNNSFNIVIQSKRSKQINNRPYSRVKTNLIVAVIVGTTAMNVKSAIENTSPTNTHMVEQSSSHLPPTAKLVTSEPGGEMQAQSV